MKEKELRESAICDICGKPIGASGIPLFYKVKIEQYALHLGAIQRQQGLTMLLGNQAKLASTMGSDEDMAGVLHSTEIIVCEDCAINEAGTIAGLTESQ